MKKYFVVDNLDWIETIDRFSLRENLDREFIHELKHITNKPENFSDPKISYFEVENELDLKLGNSYTVIYILYDHKTTHTNLSNQIQIVGIYDDVVQVNKILSAIKEDLRLHPERNEEIVVEDEIIDPSNWKDQFATVKEISSVDLIFKQ